MVRYEIEFIGDGGSDFYEGAIMWKEGYFVIHRTNGGVEGYIPLTAIKMIRVADEKEDKRYRELKQQSLELEKKEDK